MSWMAMWGKQQGQSGGRKSGESIGNSVVFMEMNTWGKVSSGPDLG